MPIREYECKKCNTVTEKIIHQKEYLGYIKCPECGYIAEMKDISQVHFQLKGNGWAKSGYSSEANDGYENS